MEDSITELFFLIDDFYKEFEEIWKHYALTRGQRKRWRMPVRNWYCRIKARSENTST